MKDLTKGKPSTLILAFALPIFLGNLLQLTYSVTDTRIVGSFLGEDALAAVGATTTLSNLIIGYDMKQGIDPLVARMERQYKGHLKKALISAIKMVGTQYAEMVRSETKA